VDIYRSYLDKIGLYVELYEKTKKIISDIMTEERERERERDGM